MNSYFQKGVCRSTDVATSTEIEQMIVIGEYNMNHLFYIHIPRLSWYEVSCLDIFLSVKSTVATSSTTQVTTDQHLLQIALAKCSLCHCFCAPTDIKFDVRHSDCSGLKSCAIDLGLFGVLVYNDPARRS
jgi:hypothetical protein